MEKAKAEYAVANEKCDDKAGDDRNVCIKEAKSVKVHAIADAKAQLKISKANHEANADKAEANADAKETGAEASKDAAADKRNADFAVAEEKCQSLAGNAKDVCVSGAKLKYAH